jgi:hypothetical protein
MPIIEAQNPALPLSQGDVLKDVRLFLTQTSWAAEGGDALKTPHKLCLIVSRPCVVGRKPHAIVAAVERFADRVPREVESFDDIREFLTDLRDGTDAPDVFYLGQVPGYEGRFGARLDSLHTVQLPQGDEALLAFVRQKRIGRLNLDFARDLHLRLFRAFASLGFDDHRWMSTEDLRWLVSRGRSEKTSAETALRDAETALHAAQAQGFKNPNERQHLERAVAAAQETLLLLEDQLAPYDVELASRNAPETT